MGDKKPVIIIISSDEDETKAGGCRRGGGGSWDDDSDDDDCVILEEDPDKPVKVVNNENGSDNSDDLLVVSEKGQVACRDYPHPRHLCVKFPFATTPHESHCDKCHCYVCDTLAPCLYWRKDGILTHCNATDKMEIWRMQRENRKKSDQKKVEQLVSCVADAAVSIGSSLPNQSLSLHHPVSNSVTTNQVPNEGPEGTLLVSSLSRNHETPNIQGSREQPGRTQNADQRAPPLMNFQNSNPHHLQHKNTNFCSPSPSLTPHHIANELNNLNLGPVANTNPPCVLESVTLNQFIYLPDRNASVSQPANLLNQNDQPNSNSNSSRYYPVPTITCIGMNPQTLSNPHPTWLSSRSKKKGKTQRP